MTAYDEIFENLMLFYSAPDYIKDVELAKSSFFERAGVMDETAPEFEQKMVQFVDWYLCSRKLSQSKLSPIKDALGNSKYNIPESHLQLYKNISNNRHSLFQFSKISGNDLHIQDLFSGYRMVIKDSDVVVGFNKGDVFEARLIPHEDSFIFTRAFCFHPPQALKFISKEIKGIKKANKENLDQAREEFLLKLYKMKSAFDQYKHVATERIYSHENNLRL